MLSFYYIFSIRSTTPSPPQGPINLTLLSFNIIPILFTSYCAKGDEALFSKDLNVSTLSVLFSIYLLNTEFKVSIDTSFFNSSGSDIQYAIYVGSIFFNAVAIRS